MKTESDTEKNPTWFLLYDGTSPDGRGHPKYIGRTTDLEKALKHFQKCAHSPNSIGEVKIINDKHERTVLFASDFKRP